MQLQQNIWKSNDNFFEKKTFSRSFVRSQNNCAYLQATSMTHLWRSQSLLLQMMPGSKDYPRSPEPMVSQYKSFSASQRVQLCRTCCSTTSWTLYKRCVTPLLLTFCWGPSFSIACGCLIGPRAFQGALTGNVFNDPRCMKSWRPVQALYMISGMQASSFKDGDYLSTLANLCSDAKTLSVNVTNNTITLMSAGGSHPKLLDFGILVGNQVSIGFSSNTLCLPHQHTICQIKTLRSRWGSRLCLEQICHRASAYLLSCKSS